MASPDLFGKLVEAEVKQDTFADAFVEDITSKPSAGTVTIGPDWLPLEPSMLLGQV